MSTPLWQHQQDAVRRLLEWRGVGGGACFAEMGCGKTLIALELASRLNARRILVLCPKSVVQVWEREPRKHGYPMMVRALRRGTCPDKKREIQDASREAHSQNLPLMVVVNYESTLGTWLWSHLRLYQWDLLILDESHRIKAPSGAQSQQAACIGAKTPYTLLLTGTPMPSEPTDVWAQFRAVDPEFLWPLDEFKRCFKRGSEQQPEFRRNLAMLSGRLAERSIRIRTRDVLSLPTSRDEVRYVSLPSPARATYNSLLRGAREDRVDREATGLRNALSRVTKLLECASGGLLVDGQHTIVHSEKEAALADILSDTARSVGGEADPVVVFATYHGDLDAIARAAHKVGRKCAELSGRRSELHEWESGRADVLAVQISAGGVGIDLSRARIAVFYSRPWSLGDYEQARARVLRPGQSRPVIYYHLVAENTIEQVVQDALARKSDVAKAVLAAV